MLPEKEIRLILEKTYKKFHHKNFIKPDPLQFLQNYPDIKDREIVGLIASSLALGRVNSIIKTIDGVLLKLPSPFNNIMDLSRKDMELIFKDFKYRFYKSGDLVDLCESINTIITNYGSLNNCFLAGYNESDNNIFKGLTLFADNLNSEKPLKMIANPHKGSACKRLNIYMRWMVRSDNIDPGGWRGISLDKLIIPLDTHMFKIGKLFSLTERNDAGIKTAIEITEKLKIYDKDDPVRYDFSLTRPGIHPDLDYNHFKFTQKPN